MSPQPTENRSRRTRKVLKSSLLLGLMLTLGTLVWERTDRGGASGSISRVTMPPRPALPPLPSELPSSMEERRALQKIWQDALDHDGRVMEPGVAVAATGLSSRHSLQLALDEVFALGLGEPSRLGRIKPRANRGELEKFAVERSAAGGASTYPILYIKDAPRLPGNARIATGEIIAALQPGVPAAEIAKAYGLRALPEGSSMVGLTRFIALNAFRALELVPKLAADPRIALVDHDLMKPVQPKQREKPNDTLFKDQWAVLPNLDLTEPQGDAFNIGLFPNIGDSLLLPTAAPVWGDFDDSDSGIRGRGIRVGIIDDGLELNHPDMQAGMAPVGEHRSYDMVEQVPQFPGEILPPRIQGSSGAEPLRITGSNRAHGVNVAGIIGARANNNIGTAGVAPNSTLVGVRAFSYSLIDGQFAAPDPTFYKPVPGDLLSPTQDVIIAAAFALSANDFSAGSFPSKKVYEDTIYEADIESFADAGAGLLMHVKNIGFGAPDNLGVLDAPGPEVAGYFRNGIYTAGARARASRDGRLGLGTVFVHPAGNGRYSVLDNANNDGYANAREAITVGALGRVGGVLETAADAVSIVSEWGANLTVVAPGGGSYWGGKTANSRLNDGRPMRAVLTTLASINGQPAVVPIATSDWTANDPLKPPTATTPAIPPLFGLNKGGTVANEYSDGNYTKRFQGTSAAAAHVSGVVALMFEANPRLSWLDVQNILIRTARNHLDPDAYALDPTAADPPKRLDGVDITDPADPVLIDRDWRKNGGHLWFNHKYGAGLVDAGRAVAEAARGILLPTQTEMRAVEIFSSSQLPVPDATGTATNVTPGLAEMTLSPGVTQDFVITQVQLRIDRILGPNIGELGITLVSPSGMESTLLEPRFDFTDDMIDWTFSSLRHWGESGSGSWKIQFRDFFKDEGTSTLDDMKVNSNLPGETGSPRVTLILHGFDRPSIPRITRPASDVAAAPTVVEVVRGEAFTYTMAAGSQPTTWFVTDPLVTANTAGLPPGLRLGIISPSEATTYLPSRLITGRTNAPLGARFDVEVQAANAGGITPVHYLQFVIVPPAGSDPFTQWGDFHFPPSSVGNPLALGSADGDGDGAINVLEYALGTSPVVADAAGATTFAKDASDQWNFTFKRYPTRGVKYELQVSNTLEAGSWVTVVLSDPALTAPAPGAGGIPVSSDAGYTVTEGALVPAGAEPQSSHHVVTVVNNPTTPPPLYYRVKVTPPRDPMNPQ
jgi:subtilisin-like proprotein convertase family protein